MLENNLNAVPHFENIPEKNAPELASNKNERADVRIEHKFADVYSIMHADKKIGEVIVPGDLAGDTYSIDIRIEDEYKGKGLGVAAYKAIIEKFDKPIETFGRTPEATRVWESLERQGLAEKTESGYRSIRLPEPRTEV